MTDDDTKPATPRAKLSTHNRLQIRTLVETWLEMSPKKRHARLEYDDGMLWAVVRDERGHVAREPFREHDEPFLSFARAMGHLPVRDAKP